MSKSKNKYTFKFASGVYKSQSAARDACKKLRMVASAEWNATTATGKFSEFYLDAKWQTFENPETGRTNSKFIARVARLTYANRAAKQTDSPVVTIQFMELSTKKRKGRMYIPPQVEYNIGYADLPWDYEPFATPVSRL